MTRERIIARIQASQIAQRLISYAESGKGMDPGRAQVCLGLLRKVVPDLSSTEIEDRREGWSEFLKRLDGKRAPAELPGESERVDDAAPSAPDAPHQLPISPSVGEPE